MGYLYLFIALYTLPPTLTAQFAFSHSFIATSVTTIPSRLGISSASRDIIVQFGHHMD